MPPLETVADKERRLDVESKATVNSSLFNYADGSSSDEDHTKSTEVTHYNDLEELD